MARWVNTAVLDSGLNHIRNNVTQIRLLSSYTAGATFGTVTTNTIASVTGLTGTSFFSLSGADARTLSSSLVTATATASAASPDLHVAFTDGTTVYWVTDETSNQPITSGNTINFPVITYISQQPSA